MLALQGPEAPSHLEALAPAVARGWRRAAAPRWRSKATPAFISRTGYTGEDGFEIVVPAADGPALWRRLLDRGVQPCGLGARDTLRLEAALALYGNDIDESTNPFEVGLGWTVTLDDGADFVGREALLRIHEAGVDRQLACLKALERGVMRAGCPLLHGGRSVGRLTSGGFSPTLGVSIGMGYLPPDAGGRGHRARRGRAGQAPAGAGGAAPVLQAGEGGGEKPPSHCAATSNCRRCLVRLRRRESRTERYVRTRGVTCARIQTGPRRRKCPCRRGPLELTYDRGSLGIAGPPAGAEWWNRRSQCPRRAATQFRLGVSRSSFSWSCAAEEGTTAPSELWAHAAVTARDSGVAVG